MPKASVNLEPAVSQFTTLRRCPGCRSKIVIPDGQGLVIKNAILRISGQTGYASAKCPRCKSWVEVPLKYGE